MREVEYFGIVALMCYLSLEEIEFYERKNDGFRREQWTLDISHISSMLQKNEEMCDV